MKDRGGGGQPGRGADAAGRVCRAQAAAGRREQARGEWPRATVLWGRGHRPRAVAVRGPQGGVSTSPLSSAPPCSQGPAPPCRRPGAQRGVQGSPRSPSPSPAWAWWASESGCPAARTPPESGGLHLPVAAVQGAWTPALGRLA